MTKAQQAAYAETEKLREILKKALAGKKFRLDWALRKLWVLFG